MRPIRLFTIGFTRKPAEEFFTKLQRLGVKRIVDVRLHNNSQLAGFAKQSDLAYFLRAIAGIDYVHLLELAPSPELFESYKKVQRNWPVFERDFISLMSKRKIEKTVPRTLLRGSCLLCSEHEPDRCHRRLVAEYLRDRWGNVKIEHVT